MRSFKVFFLFCIICSLLPSFGQNKTKTFFIKFSNSVALNFIEQGIQNNSLFESFLTDKSVSNLFVSHFLPRFLINNDENLGRIVALTLPSTMISVLNEISQDPRIEYVQENRVYKIHNLPNDSLAALQWAISKISLEQAWKVSKGKDSVIVGVIDTGIDFLHPDIKNQLFYNPGESGTDVLGRDKRTNGYDDDGNGFIDDYMGWDFTDRRGFPYDSTGGDYLNWDNYPLDENVYSHGTAVAGIIGAETDNSIGIAGVAPGIKILNLRAFDPDGYGEEDDVAAAVVYAVKMGVKVINMSFGDNSFSYVLRDVIRYAYSKNTVLVASAGNSGSQNPHYPSGYSEVICVGNSTKDDFVASSSNYGSTLDLVAPGTGIYTLARNGKYAEFNGTSAAAPFVSAVAALLLSERNFTNEEVKQIIKSTSDDINSDGWDIRSGAGRLNAGRAMTILAPAKVSFSSPFQDFATYTDTLSITATVLSPYFMSFSLYLGTGLNPGNWKILLENQKNQISDKNLYNLTLNDLPDSTYTLRIVLQQSDGRTLEERVNFHIMRTRPEVELVSIIPSNYGSSPTILTALYSKQRAVARCFYRKTGETEFKSISLDGFATNNQFVKNLHYGFLPPGFIEPGVSYELFYEVENLSGLKTTVKDSLGNNFVVTTPLPFSIRGVSEKNYSLPTGLLFHTPVNLNAQNVNEVLFNPINDLTKTYIYRFHGSNFLLVDSIAERLPKDYGDFNNNGKYDLLMNWGRSGYILEQENSGSTKMVQKFKNESGDFWPAFAKDLNNDISNEAGIITSDTTLSVYKVLNNLSLDLLVHLQNFSPKGYGGNIYDYPNALITDINKDGNNELFIVDSDGDVLCYQIPLNGIPIPDIQKSFSTGFFSSSSYIASGDYNGDGKNDLALLLHSISELDISSYHRLLIVTYNNNQIEILADRAFVDPAVEFNQFTRKTYNSIEFVNIDNAGPSELVLFIFPYAYIIDNGEVNGRVIYYSENINSNTIFSADLDQNGIVEIAFPESEKTKFIELVKNSVPTPFNVRGYSIDSTKIKLQWESTQSGFYVYRGTTPDSLHLIDSISSTQFTDSLLNLGTYYYYAVKAKNQFTSQLSDLSTIQEVFHHTPAKLISAIVQSRRIVLLTFSEKISSSINDLRTISITGLEGTFYPSSVTPASEYSYLVTFADSILPGVKTLRIDGMIDRYNSPILPTTTAIEFLNETVTQQFYIESFEIISPYEIKLTFNLDYDTLSVSNVTNYNFAPLNSVASVELKDSKTIHLKVKDRPVGALGKETVLSLSQIKSSSSSGGLLINTGAGSTVVLTSNSPNLSGVYTYPNPARLSNGSLTFANLPRFAEINILDLSGNRIITLSESDGNGGASWNMRDENGREVSSGVYFYYIRQFNDKNEELNTSLGKFTIVR